MKLQKDNLGELVRILGHYDKAHFDEIGGRLCKLGAEAVRAAYAGRFTGQSRASVTVKKEWDGWEIQAQSKGILYLEFGAGLARNPDGGAVARSAIPALDLGGQVIVPIGSGPHSRNPSGWHFSVYPYHTRGTKAANGFANAVNVIIANMQSVVDQVMGS